MSARRSCVHGPPHAISFQQRRPAVQARVIADGGALWRARFGDSPASERSAREGLAKACAAASTAWACS
eukprot:3623581-Lingulodinium_polyedra.AAC.1